MTASVILQSGGLDLLAERGRSMWAAAQSNTINLVLAIGVLVVTWALGVWIAWILRMILRLSHFDEGVRQMLGAEIIGAHEPSRVAARALQWLTVICGGVLAFDVLGFQLGDELARRLNEVLPRVLAAAILLGAGVVIAMSLGALTRRFFDTSGLGGGRLRGQVVMVLFTLFSALLALEQLGFAAEFVMIVGVVAVGAVGLGLALSFGLGCRDLARDLLVEYLRSLEQGRSERP